MSKKVILNIRNEVWVTLDGLSREHHDFLWEKFAPYVDGYRHMLPFKLGRWDGRIRFYEKTGKTYVKLLSRIVPYLDQWNYEIDLIDNRQYFELPAQIDENIFAEHGFVLRPYQVQSINSAIQNGSGFILAGTGAGKTSITAAISHAFSSEGYDCITIVPSADLVDQTVEFYRKVGLDTGVYSGANKEIHHANVVATWQALQYNHRILEKFKALIWDEAHGCKATVGQKLLNESAAHIPFKFGVTGTFPKPEADQLSLHSAVGDILIEISARWLIDNGYLAEVDIKQICLKQPDKQQFPDYAAERTYLSKNTERMDVIADIIINGCQEYGNTLVLVNSVPFGQNLSEIISDAVFLYGGSKKEERREQYDLFESRDDMIVIATSGIASTGISIDRVKCLVFVDAGKSFIKAIQSVGRGTRLASDKKMVNIIDIFADLTWSKKHAKERAKWYKEAKYVISSTQTIKI